MTRWRATQKNAAENTTDHSVETFKGKEKRGSYNRGFVPDQAYPGRVSKEYISLEGSSDREKKEETSEFPHREKGYLHGNFSGAL